MFTDAIKDMVGHRVRICTFETTTNGFIEDVSADAIKLRPEMTEAAPFMLNPMWVVSVRRLEE